MPERHIDEPVLRPDRNAVDVAEREDVAPRRGGDTPRYGDRPKGPPPGPKPALRFPLAGADDPASLDRPRAAPVPSTEAVPIVAGEDIDGFDGFGGGDADEDTQAWAMEEEAVAEEGGDPEGDGDDEYVYEYEYEYVEVEAEVDADDPDVLSFDPPSEEVALPHWTEPATGEVPQVLVDDEADARELLDAELVAAGRAGVRADAARHHDARLERQVLDELPDFRWHFLLDDYALYDTCAVAYDDESDAPVNACRLDPALHGGAVCLVPAEVPDI